MYDSNSSSDRNKGMGPVHVLFAIRSAGRQCVETWRIKRLFLDKYIPRYVYIYVFLFIYSGRIIYSYFAVRSVSVNLNRIVAMESCWAKRRILFPRQRPAIFLGRTASERRVAPKFKCWPNNCAMMAAMRERLTRSKNGGGSGYK